MVSWHKPLCFAMQKYNLILIIFVLLGATACSSVQAMDTPTSLRRIENTLTPTTDLPTPGITLLSTATSTLLATAIPTETVSQTPTVTITSKPLLSTYASLPPGQYIVYSDSSMGSNDLYAISSDGKYKQFLTGQIGQYSVAILPNGYRLLVYQNSADYILDMKNNERIEFENTAYRSSCGADYSPDLSKAALCCGDNEVIYVQFLHDHLRLPLNTPNQGEFYCFPFWSPDGKWIAFFNLTHNPGYHDPEEGLYLADTSCLSQPDTCPAKIKGPYKGKIWMFTQIPLVWSPDSRYLAMLSDQRQPPIQIFDLKTRGFRFLEIEDSYDGIEDLLWSPDGKWLVYSGIEHDDGTSDIFLISVSGGLPIRLVDSPAYARAYFWLTISAFEFNIGSVYAITEAGANLNLSDAPSLNGTIVKKLLSGDVVTLIDGPVEADGYRWWKIRIDADGVEGWAVEHLDWYKPVNP